MTNEEAIKTIEIAIAEVEWEYPMEYAVAFEMAIDALRKQIPKKPVETNDEKPYLLCPTCGKALWVISHHCECGQDLDFGR